MGRQRKNDCVSAGCLSYGWHELKAFLAHCRSFRWARGGGGAGITKKLTLLYQDIAQDKADTCTRNHVTSHTYHETTVSYSMQQASPHRCSWTMLLFEKLGPQLSFSDLKIFDVYFRGGSRVGKQRKTKSGGGKFSIFDGWAVSSRSNCETFPPALELFFLAMFIG